MYVTKHVWMGKNHVYWIFSFPYRIKLHIPVKTKYTSCLFISFCYFVFHSWMKISICISFPYKSLLYKSQTINHLKGEEEAGQRRNWPLSCVRPPGFYNLSPFLSGPIFLTSMIHGSEFSYNPMSTPLAPYMPITRAANRETEPQNWNKGLAAVV